MICVGHQLQHIVAKDATISFFAPPAMTYSTGILNALPTSDRYANESRLAKLDWDSRINLEEKERKFREKIRCLLLCCTYWILMRYSPVPYCVSLYTSIPLDGECTGNRKRSGMERGPNKASITSKGRNAVVRKYAFAARASSATPQAPGATRPSLSWKTTSNFRDVVRVSTCCCCL